MSIWDSQLVMASLGSMIRTIKGRRVPSTSSSVLCMVQLGHQVKGFRMRMILVSTRKALVLEWERRSSMTKRSFLDSRWSVWKKRYRVKVSYAMLLAWHNLPHNTQNTIQLSFFIHPNSGKFLLCQISSIDRIIFIITDFDLHLYFPRKPSDLSFLILHSTIVFGIRSKFQFSPLLSHFLFQFSILYIKFIISYLIYVLHVFMIFLDFDIIY